MKIYTLVVGLLLSLTQLFAQSNTVSVGGEATGSGGTASMTAGEVFYTHKVGSLFSVTEGVQQGFSNQFTITFDSNGGVGTMEIQYVDTSAIATIAVNTFTRVGYTFVGWNTAADGTGTSYANGAIYTMRDAGDVTLYAQWVLVPTISAGGPLTFCVGENVVLTSSSATGNQWYKGGVLIADAINETYNATETGVYTVNVTTAGVESVASAGTSVTSNSLPTASISNNTGTTVLPCPTSAISVTATGGVSYAWDNGLGNVAMVRITTPGTYTVTVTSANGCEGSTSVAVTVNQSNVPAPLIVSIIQPRCQPFIDGKCGLSGLPAGNWTLMQLGTVAKTITGSGSTFTVDQLSDGVYRFVVIDQDGCPSPPTSPFGAVIRTY